MDLSSPSILRYIFHIKPHFSKKLSSFSDGNSTRQQSSNYYYQVCERSNSISCLKFHIEKKCWGIINLDNHYSIKPERGRFVKYFRLNFWLSQNRFQSMEWHLFGDFFTRFIVTVQPIWDRKYRAWTCSVVDCAMPCILTTIYVLTF
jgi:hypothetical protein